MNVSSEIRIIDFGSSLKLPYDKDKKVYITKIPLTKQRIYGKYNCMAPEILW